MDYLSFFKICLNGWFYLWVILKHAGKLNYVSHNQSEKITVNYKMKYI